jgi:hypothetical protein
MIAPGINLSFKFTWPNKSDESDQSGLTETISVEIELFEFK